MEEWAYKRGIEPLIIAYLQYDNSKLFEFEPQVDTKAFATPRSWEYIDRILKLNLNVELKYKLFVGAIGEDSANSFFSFLKIAKKIPNLDSILRGEEVELEDDGNILFATVAGLVSRAKEASKDEIENIIKFALTIPPEFSIMLIKDLEQSGVNLYDSKNS